MRALVCHEWGEIDQLRVEALEPPVPAPDQVLIKVAACAVNYADAIMVSGNYQTKPPFPFAPGLEAAGTVAEVGDEVEGFKIGDRVMALLDYGGMAEYAIAKYSDTWVIPDRMSLRDAAAFPIAYLSSDVALRWQGRVEPGETVLVLGAAGGVGLTAVEISKAMGAKVIAAASTDEKLEAAKSHGADALINYSSEDLKARVAEITSEAGADVCFDPVGGELFNAALSSLGWGGRFLHVGFVGGVPQIPSNRLLVKHRSAMGSSLRYFRWYAPEKLQASMAALLGWYSEQKLKPLVTHEHDLAGAAAAIKRLTERTAFGRVLVNIDASA